MDAKRRLEPLLVEKGGAWGDSVFIRIFKNTKELEVWFKKDSKYVHLKTYPICYFSGSLGPKKRTGDLQAPEGIYYLHRKSFNPSSAYHLSLNVGYPNAYDTQAGNTGGLIMIHGDCVSLGCFAMQDAGIEEIYSLAESALNHGQEKIKIHIFPFRMNWFNMWKYHRFSAFDFWKQLIPIYKAFDDTEIPPEVRVKNGEYQLTN